MTRTFQDSQAVTQVAYCATLLNLGILPLMTPHTSVALTPIAFVHGIIEAYQRRGLSPEAALRSAQIPPTLLTQAHARITSSQMERISGHAMRELDDEALGWFSRRLPWGSYGMLARASISSPTLGIALRRWCRHHGLLTDDVTLSLQVQAGHATLTLLEQRDLGTLREFCQVSLLRNVLGVASWLIDSRIPLRAVQLAFPMPGHADAYRVLLPAPVTFDAPATVMTFDADYLSLPLRRDELALNQMLRHALPLLVQNYRRDRLLVERARQWLRAQPDQTHNAQGLARLLHMSVRTLHRHLHEEGTSLQSLKDAVRHERAQDLLQRTHMPVKQVAEATGFRHEKSFIRAFRHHTGMTPAAFRRSSRLHGTVTDTA